MKMGYIVFIVFFNSLSVYGVQSLKEMKIDQTTFSLDTIPDSIGEERIEKHLKKMLEIHSKLKEITPNLKKINSSIKDTISVVRIDSRHIGYDKLDKLGISGLAFDNNNILKSLSFYTTGGRNITREELQEYKRTRKVPSSYATITEEEAIALARKLHRLVYGKEEDEKFDSVRVYHGSRDYTVHFYIKVKNDIRDWRSSSVTINANSGEIKHFSCEGLNKSITYDYTPKIPKSRAIEIFNAEIERFHSDIKMEEIYLAKRENAKGVVRWAWQIFGDRQGFMATADVLYIDSETGEILFNQVGR